MDFTSTTALVTGANRGLGRALVDSLLDRGAARVYATARDPYSLRTDERIVPLALDLTDPASIEKAALAAADIDLLVNNAGAAEFASALDADPAAVAREFAVNVTGPYLMTRAFVPTLAARGGRV